MTSAQLVFSLTCLFLGEIAHLTSSTSVRQVSGFISADVGESVTLQCFYEGSDSAWLFWYIQTLGQKPRLISKFYVYDTEYTCYNEFRNNSRFAVDIENRSYHLKILDLKQSDSATYYCAANYATLTTFAEGITVRVRGLGSGIQASVQQSESETIQQGGSKTLSCAVDTGTCDGEHSVYWFKDSGESHPGLIYANGGRNDQCERSSNTKTNSCSYNLPMRNLNMSDDGVYYCAVVSCGHILFGNGTKVDFHDVDSLVLVYLLSGALAFTSILSAILGFFLYKRNSCQAPENPERFSAPSTANTEACWERDSHYATLSVNLLSSSRRQRNTTDSECVYSGVNA